MKNTYKIILIVAFVIVTIAVLLFQFDIFSIDSDYKNRLDTSFEMIDPENPTTTADNIVRVKKEYERNKLEKCILQQLKIELVEKKNSLNELSDKHAQLNIKNDASFLSYLELYSVSSLYDFNWLSNTSSCIGYSNNSSPKNLQIQFLYQTNQKNYSNAIKSILLNSDVPQRNIVKFTTARFYYDDYNESYDYPTLLEGYESKNIFKDSIVAKNRSRQIIQQINNLAVSKFSNLNNTILKREKVLDSILVIQQKTYSESVAKYAGSRLDINDKAIKYGIFAFCFTALIMYLAGLYIRSIQMKQNDNRPSNETSTGNEEARLSMWYSVYMITVLLLIITIFILGLARLLTENSLAALLGGIAGYVLNNKMGDTLNLRQVAQTSPKPIPQAPMSPQLPLDPLAPKS